MTDNCKHSWVAPSWLRDHGDHKDLPMVCEKCQLFSCLDGIEHKTIQELIVHFSHSAGFSVNTVKYIKQMRLGGRD